MATLKRNDPCLCGSGKKYKKCCLIKLQDKPTFDQADQRAFNELLPKIFDYSKTFDEEIQPVYEQYVHSFERLPKADAQAFSQLLFHWMLFNYPLENNKTILDDYISTHSSTYSDHFQQFLQDWKALEPKLFRITNSDAKNMVVYDVFQDHSMTLEKTPASANLNEGDRLIGFLYPTPKGYTLGNDAIAIPKKLEEAFLVQWESMNQVSQLSKHKSNETEQSMFTRHFHDVLEVLSLIAVSGKTLQAEESLENKSKQVLTLLMDKLDWSSISFAHYLQAKVTWISYATEQSPRIQKPETFAAAMEYWISKLHDSTHVSQKKLAEKYTVSAGTISNKYKAINEN
ncbi:SEC-C metal-binding domain-containing protein [Salipaludibacillus daqingensis]|uniref:SEC-C metal-binding domain-containing protein n=1 Tax=Salipaludibacillus daqingensis TaxID=3041001 RepID=UPI0024738F3A|nr:SEC-C metal-binding domain-containing protein [Salipaludibacillus daqingensis]